MNNNYIYRMDHDRGFAPNTSFGICSLTGCKNSKNKKRRNIEEMAKPGSWVIGIGGRGHWKVSNEDIKKLKSHLSEEYEYGVHRDPNNPVIKGKCEEC